jgi:Putative transposase
LQASTELRGFNLNAAVRIEASDDLGRERLCRYAARPPLSLDRLRRLPGDRVSYRIKNSRGGKTKHRIMTGVEVLARLAALIPPPRFPLVRYHGVIAPNSSWRKSIVPQPPAPPATTHTHRSEDGRHTLPHEPKKKATELRGSVRDKPKRTRPQSDADVEHHSNVTVQT